MFKPKQNDTFSLFGKSRGSRSPEVLNGIIIYDYAKMILKPP